MRRVLAGLLICILVFTGCGYSFQGTGQNRPAGVNTLNIPTAVNSTTYTILTDSLTNNLIQEFNRSRAFRIVGTGEAQGELLVQIVAMEIEGASTSTSSTSSASRRVVVSASANLVRKSDGKSLWSGSGITAYQWYSATGSQSLVESNLNDALEQTAKELAETIHNRIVEGF